MKRFFTLLLISSSFSASAQTVCGTANENETLTLTAPPGMIFNSIIFASYGTPNGSCGSYTVGTCNATNSTSLVSAAFMGKNSASIDATNAVFGDPCNGTTKRLYVEAGYYLPLPLTLVSFTAQKADDKVRLQWITNDEVNTLDFVIEQSNDGNAYNSVGTVAAKGKSVNQYEFTTVFGSGATTYFRLRMRDKDSKFTYSNSLRVNSAVTGIADLRIYPNPAKDFISIRGLSGSGQLRLLDASGALLQQINIMTAQSSNIDISKYPHGVYIMQFVTEKNIVSQKLLK
jgi:hypothetical protein